MISNNNKCINCDLKVCKNKSKCDLKIRTMFIDTKCEVCNYVVTEVTKSYVEAESGLIKYQCFECDSISYSDEKELKCEECGTEYNECDIEQVPNIIQCIPIDTKCSQDVIDLTQNCMICGGEVITELYDLNPNYRNTIHLECWEHIDNIIKSVKPKEPGPCVICGLQAPALPLCNHPETPNCKVSHCEHNIHPECQSLMDTVTTNAKPTKNMSKINKGILETTYDNCKVCMLPYLVPTVKGPIKCTWCNEPIKKNMYRNIGCQHQFHIQCAYKWFDNNDCCKECDKPYPKVLVERVRAYEPPGIVFDKKCSGCGSSLLKHVNTRCEHQYCNDCIGGTECRVCGEHFTRHYIKYTNMACVSMTDGYRAVIKGVGEFMKANRGGVLSLASKVRMSDSIITKVIKVVDTGVLDKCIRCDGKIMYKNIKCSHQYCKDCIRGELSCPLCETNFSYTYVNSMLRLK